MGAQCTSPQSAPWYASFFMDPGVKWCRMKTGNVFYMHAVPWIAICMLFTRSFVESYIATPLGLHLHVSDKKCGHPETSVVLSKAFEKCKNPGEELLQLLAREVGWTPYKVHKWFWKARQFHRPSQLTKFKESTWRFLVYMCTSIVGLWYISKEPFFWNRVKCYEGFPMNTPSDLVLLYWACQLGFYISLLISHHSDIRRSDYLLMVIHHVFTVLLLGMAYVMNGVQIGTLILLVHDISDVPLELAKLFKYIRFERFAQVTFGVFTFFFFITRLIIYPFFLLWSVLFEYPVVISHSPAWWLMVVMLVLLQVMHMYWFNLIYQMAKALVVDTNMERDIRSDAELSPHTYEENTVTEDIDGPLSGESSQLSLGSEITGSGNPVDPDGSTHVHRRRVY